jgi:hypothetical protein
MLGMTPSQYRAGGAGEEIKFAVDQSFLGAILVASSKKGVAAILLGDGPEKLVRDLQDRFPKARLTGADQDYEVLVARVVGFVETPPDLRARHAGARNGGQGWPVFGPPRQRREASLTAASTTAGSTASGAAISLSNKQTIKKRPRKTIKK